MQEITSLPVSFLTYFKTKSSTGSCAVNVHHLVMWFGISVWLHKRERELTISHKKVPRPRERVSSALQKTGAQIKRIKSDIRAGNRRKKWVGSHKTVKTLTTPWYQSHLSKSVLVLLGYIRGMHKHAREERETERESIYYKNKSF